MTLGAPFIVGVSRSGTTMLRLMLDAHSELAIPPETNFGAALAAFDRGGPRAAVDAIVETDQWRDTGLSAEEFASRVEQRGADDLGGVLRAFYELYAARSGKSRWGDKSPYYVGMMVRVQELLPEARFVHAIRDGRDVALSVVPLWFGPNTIADAARWWSGTIDVARRQAKGLRFYTEVRFESLVRDPATTLGQVCDFCELEWEPSMLDYHRSALGRLEGETADWQGSPHLVSSAERLAIHRLIGTPPDPARLDRWRREMSADDVLRFERIAGDRLEELGYEVSEGLLSGDR